MSHLLHELRWTSAVVGVILLIIGILMTGRRQKSVGRNFGWFAVQFGCALLLFDASGLLVKNHAWSTAAALAGVILLASSVRKLFQLRSK